MLHRARSAIFIGLPFAIACTQAEPTTPEPSETKTSEPTVSQTASSVTLAQRIEACNADPRVITGLVSVDVCVGADLFFRETFAGNGRSCGTCHPVENNFTIDVPFLQSLPPNDPLFIAENNPDLAGLEIPAQMRGRGLILENLDGFAPDPKTRFVLRSVPHTFSMGVTITRASGDTVNPPADRTGWSGDGAPGAGTLRDFQTGAITQHYTRSLARRPGVDFRLAEAGELDRIDLYMRQLGRTNELNLALFKLTDARAELGRQAFLTVGCNACHGNAGANASFGGGGNRNFNTGVETARNPNLQFFPHDGGFLQTANASGTFGDGTFNTPSLIEAADTGPFFHTDTSISGASAHNTQTANTIEQAIAFYDSPAFNNSPSGLIAPINLTATQIDDIGRFLRVVNAAFNIQLGLKRLNAALTIVQRFGNDHLPIQRRLMALAVAEALDAIAVLEAKGDLNEVAISSLHRAIHQTAGAQTATSALSREGALFGGIEELETALFELGPGIDFTIGAGNLMF